MSGWTIDTLRAHVDRVFVERDRRYEERHTAQQIALNTALAALDIRLDHLNELRNGVATKGEVDALHTRLDEMKERLDKDEGAHVGVRMTGGFIATAFGVIASVAVIVNIAAILIANY